MITKGPSIKYLMLETEGSKKVTVVTGDGVKNGQKIACRGLLYGQPQMRIEGNSI